MKTNYFYIFLLILPSLFFAVTPEEEALLTPTPEQTEITQETPWGFAGIELGMKMDTVESILDESKYFIYDSKLISWLPFTPLISAKGRGLINVGHFHFVDDQLYSINLIINPIQMDYYTLMTQFNEKYGKYSSLDPSRVLWLSETASISLEKPLTVSYLDLELHQIYINQSEIEKSNAQQTREEFLDEF